MASGTREFTDIIIVKLQYEGITGFGEASLPPYLTENVNSVRNFLNKVQPAKLNIDHFEETLNYVDEIEPGNNAAKAAVDIALNDLRGKLTQKPVWEIYNIAPVQPLYSTYTIGISSPQILTKKLNDSKGFPLIKLKLGSKDDKGLVESYLRLSDKPFCVDVNQGWRDKFEALDMIGWLTEKGVQFIEQPMPKAMVKETGWITQRSPVPIVADESVQRLEDIEKLQGIFSGINVKLMKSSGIHEGVKMINKAKEMGFKVLVGCMAESSCAVTAAAHLAPLADWADLDGPQLIENDPFEGLLIEHGRIIMPENPGLGVELKAELIFD